MGLRPSVKISTDHPRHRSLMVRERLSEAVEEGIVTPTGMIAHGRGEAFDYLLGERTIPSADYAERVAASLLLNARNPVLCVNGNAAVVAGKQIVLLSQSIPANVEVNLFHRNEERMEKVISYMEGLGCRNVLGRSPDSLIPGIASERARCCSDGIYGADVIMVPIEDGDRAQALAAMGKVVITIDLNPLSRTSKAATVPIVDEASRAVKNIRRHVDSLRDDEKERLNCINSFNAEDALQRAVAEICASLSQD